MRDTRQSSPIMTLLLAVAAAGLAVSAFFLPDVHECTVSIVQPEWLSNVLSLLTLLAVAVSLNYVNSNNFQFSSDSKLLYLPYLLAVMAFPGAITLTYCHLAAFLTVWTLYFTLMYVNGEYHRLYYAFMAGLVSSLSALLLPPLLYVCAFILLYIIYLRGQDIIRLLLAYLSAVLLPWVYAAVWMIFFRQPGALKGFLADFGAGLSPSLPAFSGMDILTAVYLSLLGLIGIRAVVYIVSRSHERNKAQKNAFGLSAALSIFVLALELLFGGTMTSLSVIVAAVPFSFAVFNFLSNGRRVETSLLLSLLLLAAVLLRVFGFLNL